MRHQHTIGNPEFIRPEVLSGLPGLLCAGSLSQMFLPCCCHMPDLHSNLKGMIYFYFLAPFSSSAESYSLLVLGFFFLLTSNQTVLGLSLEFVLKSRY